MDSELQIHSEKEIGTIISFEILFSKSKIENSPLKRIDFELIDLTGVKILLVEDNKINRLIAGKALEMLGTTYVEAINGIEAIEILKNESFDLILMDIQMPEMDGVEATKWIRNQMNISTPIVALTANVFRQDIDSYLEIGMNDYIIKPFDEEDFLKKISENVKTGK
jgi:CheY-like chemotaxis protein